MTSLGRGGAVLSAGHGWHLGGLVLGTAIGLVGATQLRIPGLNVGAGEALLAAWIVGSVLVLLHSGRVARSQTAFAYGLFLILTLAALCAGWAIAMVLGVWQPGFVRDAVAILLSVIVIAILIADPALIACLRSTWAALVPVTVIPVTIFLLFAVTGRLTLGPLQLTADTRFRGWAENPNQLALAILPIPAFAWMQFQAARTRVGRVWAFGLLVGGLVAGMASFSDALFLAWGAGAFAGFAHWWVQSVVAVRSTLLRRTLSLMVIPALALATVATAAPVIARAAVEAAEEQYQLGGQGGDRLRRWVHGVEAGLRSPIVGLGPGSYSGPLQTFEGEEAHNVFIDWFASTGVIGALCLLGLVGWTGLRILTSGSRPLLFAFTALLAFMTFHFVLRQPVAWLFLVTLTALSGRDAPVKVR